MRGSRGRPELSPDGACITVERFTVRSKKEQNWIKSRAKFAQVRSWGGFLPERGNCGKVNFVSLTIILAQKGPFPAPSLPCSGSQREPGAFPTRFPVSVPPGQAVPVLLPPENAGFRGCISVRKRVAEGPLTSYSFFNAAQIKACFIYFFLFHSLPYLLLNYTQAMSLFVKCTLC